MHEAMYVCTPQPCAVMLLYKYETLVYIIRLTATDGSVLAAAASDSGVGYLFFWSQSALMYPRCPQDHSISTYSPSRFMVGRKS